MNEYDYRISPLHTYSNGAMAASFFTDYVQSFSIRYTDIPELAEACSAFVTDGLVISCDKEKSVTFQFSHYCKRVGNKGVDGVENPDIITNCRIPFCHATFPRHVMKEIYQTLKQMGFD